MLCLEEKPALTDEHIIQKALGSGNYVLSKAVCKECQEKCNKDFEQKFLKGSNFTAFLRAALGIRGRRNAPVYGFDRHGKPLEVIVEPGFPPVKIGIGARPSSGGIPKISLERPPQLVLVDETNAPIVYHFLPDRFQFPILENFFSEIVESIPENAKSAVLWFDGDIISIPINAWKQLSNGFEYWCSLNNLSPLISTAPIGNNNVEFELDWNTEYRNRALVKICLMYALSQMKHTARYDAALNDARHYILDGISFPIGFWQDAPVLQWNGTYPAQDVLQEKSFHYFLATLNIDGCLFSLIRLHTIGLFAVKLSSKLSEALCDDSATIYTLKHSPERGYFLEHQALETKDVYLFAQSVKSSNQLRV